MRNREKYRGARPVVAAAMINPTMPIVNGTTKCPQRSSLLSLLMEILMAQIAAKTYGGAVRRRESTLLYLNVATRVGINEVTAAALVFVMTIIL